MPRPSRTSKRRSRGNKRRSSGVHRAFGLLSRRPVIGVVWILAALLCVLVVGLDPLSLFEPWGWTQARSEPEMAQGLALVMILGVSGMVALFWSRWNGEGAADRERSWSGDLPEIGGDTKLATVGMIAMAVGLSLVSGDWLMSHRALPAGELILPVNSEQESYEVRQGDRDIDVMLPLRMTLRDVNFGDNPSIGVQFYRPKQNRPAPQVFAPAQTLDVEGFRFAFSGFASGETSIRAVMSSTKENTIADSGVPGDQLRFEIDGPQFRVVDAVENYQDFLGPAVQLEDGEGDKFWVFQRASQMEDPPENAYSLVLDELQFVPAAAMTVTSVRPFWPFGLGVTLFMIGFAHLFFFPERRFRRRDDETIEFLSLNRSEIGWSGDERTLLENPRSSPAATGLQGAALAALGASFFWAPSMAAILAYAAVIAFVALPNNLHRKTGVRTAMIAASLPVGLLVVSAIVGGSAGGAVGSLDTEAALWTAHLGSWAAMATGLLGSGIAAGVNKKGRSTGAITAALAIVAGAVSILVVGMQRGSVTGVSFGLPLESGGEPVWWGVPGVSALSSLQLPVVGDGSWALGWLGAIIAGSVLGVAGGVMRRKIVAGLGWAFAAGGSFWAAAVLARDSEVGAGVLETAGYETLARQWLQSQNLPTSLVGRGEIMANGALVVDASALMPEIGALILMGVIAAAMLGATFFFPIESEELEAPAGRDLFVRAVMFGFMGWILGLILTWERLGAAGVLAPMEWLGLSVPLFAMGLLMIGWRRGPTPPERFIGQLGPALALAYLVVVVAFGAAAGVVPGASVGF